MTLVSGYYPVHRSFGPFTCCRLTCCFASPADVHTVLGVSPGPYTYRLNLQGVVEALGPDRACPAEGSRQPRDKLLTFALGLEESHIPVMVDDLHGSAFRRFHPLFSFGVAHNRILIQKYGLLRHGVQTPFAIVITKYRNAIKSSPPTVPR